MGGWEWYQLIGYALGLQCWAFFLTILSRHRVFSVFQFPPSTVQSSGKNSKLQARLHKHIIILIQSLQATLSELVAALPESGEYMLKSSLVLTC